MPKNYNSNTIPRPLNCFLIYRLEKQQEIVNKCAGANHRDISKIIAKWWKEASEEEKRPFREKARLSKLEHKKLYPDYKYTPKKKTTPKRVYNRRNKKEPFTSRTESNNKVMEMIYDDPSSLDQIPSVAPKCEVVIKQESPEPANYLSFEEDEDLVPIKYECVSPSTEFYSENDIASPFTCSTPSFESVTSGMLSPYEFLDTPRVDTSDLYTVHSNDYFNMGYNMNIRIEEDNILYNNFFIYQTMPPAYEYINPKLLHML